MNKTSLILYYNRFNRYGFNFLLGALETDSYFDELPVFFVCRDSEWNNIKEIVEENDLTIVAFSFTTPQIFEIANIVTFLRKACGKKIFLIAGGPHPSGDPAGTLQMGFDAVFIGEGEKSFPLFLKAMNKGEDISGIRGVAFQGTTKFTKAEPVEINDYPPFSERWKLFGPIEITRGCPFGCSFCETPFLLNREYRHRSIENIIYFSNIMKKNNLLAFRAITPNALSYGSNKAGEIRLDLIENLLKELSKLYSSNLVEDASIGIYFGSFPSEIRPEYITEEALWLIKKYCINRTIIIGAQFGSTRMLNLYRRGHSVEDVKRAAKLILKAGFKAEVDFLFFAPDETLQDVKDTVALIKELKKMGAYINTHSFLPLAGTPLYGKINNDSEYLKYLQSELEKLGYLYGNWKRQYKISIKLADYFKSNKPITSLIQQ